jgi:hypothetical protein
MRPRTPAVLVLAGLLAAGACTGNLVRPSNGAWRLSGTIDSTAAIPIAGARLTVQEGANRDAQATSDASGRYSFARLESGRFTIVIDAPGFVSVTPVVDLYEDLEVNFALRRPE